MEYLEGQTVATRLERDALPVEAALTIAIEMADALDKVHRTGVTHRDLKPANIFFTKAGSKLLDFWLAKTGPPVVAASGATQIQTAPPNLTAEGTILGTFQAGHPSRCAELPAVQ